MPDVPSSASFPHPDLSSCVSVGPPPQGVTVREPDLAWRPAEAMAQDLLLIDVQQLVEEHCRYSRVVERLNAQLAVQSRSQWQKEFDPATDTVTVHWLRVHRDGAVIDHTDPARFRCLQREENLERCAVDGTAMLLVLLEDIRPGDVLDTALTIHTRPRLLQDHFYSFVSVSYPVHVGELYQTYRFRADRPLAWKSNIASLTPVESQDGGMKELRWERRAIKPLATEENVPGWHLQGGWFQVSDFSSWQEVAAKVHEAWSALDTLEGLEETVQRIQAAAPDLPGQVEAALRIVQDEIRYLSVNLELGGQIPSAPGVVMRRRFGDCKDKSRLLASLLQALGVKAAAVLVHTVLRRELRNWLPSPLFDHAIISYELDGVQHYVDATISMQGGGSTRRFVPHYHAGLLIQPSGMDGLCEIQPPPGSLGRTQLKESFEIDPRGGESDLFVTLHLTGSDADQMRAEIHHLGMDGVARNREQFYRNWFPGLKRLGALEWLDDREKNAAVLAERFELPATPQVLPVQYYPVNHSAWLVASHLPGTGEVKRKRPFRLPGPAHVEHQVEVISPSLPVYSRGKDTIRCPAFTCSWATIPTVGSVCVRFVLELAHEEVTPDALAVYMEKLHKVYAAKEFQFLVPTGRQMLRRRAQGPLLSQHNEAAALVDQDLLRESHQLEAPVHPPKDQPQESRARRNARPLSGDELISNLRADSEASAPSVKRPSGLLAPGGREDFTIPGQEETLEPASRAAAPAPAAAPASGEKERRRQPGRTRAAEYRKPSAPWPASKRAAVVFGALFAAIIVAVVVIGIMGESGNDGYDAALRDAQRKSSMDPDIVEAGRLLDAGNAPAAKALFDIAGPRHQLSVNAQILGARIELALGNTDRARDIAGEWEAKCPDYIALRRLRIEVHTARKEYPQAIRLAEENAAKSDAQSWDLFLLAHTCYEAGDYRAAEKPLSDYLKLEAADHQARSMLSQLLLLTGRTTEVAPLWKDALKRFPSEPQVAALAARHLQDAGLPMDAARTIEEASARFPGSAAIAFQHALLLKASDAQAAFDKFRLAATLDPAWIDPVLNAALILEQAGHADAPAAFRQAAERCRDSASLLTAARSLIALSPRGAIFFLEKALSLDPSSDDAWTLLASCYEKQGNSAKAAAATGRDRRILQRQ